MKTFILLFWMSVLSGTSHGQFVSPPNVDCSDPANDTVQKCPQNFYPNPKKGADPVVREFIDEMFVEARSQIADLSLLERKIQKARADLDSWFVLPSRRRKLEAEAKRLEDEAKVKKEKMTLLVNGSIYMTYSAYGLEPREFPRNSDYPPQPWNPKYGGNGETVEQCKKRTRSSACFPIFGGTTPEGSILIFRNSLLLAWESNGAMDGGADRLATTILHETIHWVDRAASGGREWSPREVHEAEKRATQSQIEYGKKLGPDAIPLKQLDDWAKLLAFHQEAMGVIDSIDLKDGVFGNEVIGWDRIPEKYRMPTVSPEASAGPSAGMEKYPELVKTESGRQFIESWDTRAQDVLEKMKAKERQIVKENEHRRKVREFVEEVDRRYQARKERARLEERLRELMPGACSGDYFALIEVAEIWNEMKPAEPKYPGVVFSYIDIAPCEDWLFDALLRRKEDGRDDLNLRKMLNLLSWYENFVEKMKALRPVPGLPRTAPSDPPRVREKPKPAPRRPPVVVTPVPRKQKDEVPSGIPMPSSPW